MLVNIMKEAGYKEALIGLGLSYDLTSSTKELSPELAAALAGVARKLYNKEDGHNKFLESMQMWIDVTAPRFWHSEADTYRVGESKQSLSTIHTILKNPLTQSMFERPIPLSTLEYLEILRVGKDFEGLKNMLPEGFLQRRIWNVNYKVLRNILRQRKNHKLKQWQYFCNYIYVNAEHSEFFDDIFSK